MNGPVCCDWNIFGTDESIILPRNNGGIDGQRRTARETYFVVLNTSIHEQKKAKRASKAAKDVQLACMLTETNLATRFHINNNLGLLYYYLD
jgi:hypothetical protein